MQKYLGDPGTERDPVSATRKGAEEQNQVTSVKNTTKDRRI